MTGLPDWLQDDAPPVLGSVVSDWTPGPGWAWRKVCPDCGTLVVPREPRPVDWAKHRAGENCRAMADLMRNAPVVEAGGRRAT